MLRLLAITFVLSTLPVMAPAQDKGPQKDSAKKSAPKPRPRPEAFTDATKAGPDFAIQGEYRDSRSKHALQVIALGDARFVGRAFVGGLPGDGWDGKQTVSAKAEAKNGVVEFDFGRLCAKVADGRCELGDAAGTTAVLARVVRASPTVGLKPPPHAVVLFDGRNAEAWEKGQLIEGDLLRCGTRSKAKFMDFSMHLEFRTPFTPKATGQSRGNSGVYIQGRYEIQILDSFGLEGKNNECGGVYQLAAPRVNMCFPPLSWQTYDVDFTSARVDAAGKKTANAVITVRHNGVVIHDRLAITEPTGGHDRPENGEPGPISLQNHGNPVVFRNIWVVEKK